jgi:hypothetical protein
MEEIAVTVSLFGYFVFMIHTWTDDDLVTLLIATADPAGAVLFAGPAFYPREATEDNIQLFFVGIQGISVFPGIFLRPFTEPLDLLLIGL